MPSGWELVRPAHQDTAYNSSTSNKKQPAGAPQTARAPLPEIAPPKDTASSDANAPLITAPSALPSGNPSQNADAGTRQDAVPQEQKSAAAPEPDAPPTTSGLAPSLSPKATTPDTALNSPKDIGSQEPAAPATTSGLASPSTSAHDGEATPHKDVLPHNANGSAVPNSVPPSHPVKTSQNTPPSLSSTPGVAAAAPKRRAPSEYSQKMWYK